MNRRWRENIRPRLAMGGTLACLAVIFCVLSAQSGAEVVQHGDIRVALQGGISPTRLPRDGAAPVKVSVAMKISGVDGATPPLLRRIQLSINKEGRFDRAGLPVCTLEEIQPTTDADALAACGGSLVGKGQFSAQVGFASQAPFPSAGRILAFNGTYEGHPAILAHVYGSEPAPTSYTLPFVLSPLSGTYGTRLTAALPDAAGTSGYITGLSLELGRNFTAGGSRRSFISAECPAPTGFPGATFPFVHALFGFSGGQTLGSTLTRNCQAAGR